MRVGGPESAVQECWEHDVHSLVQAQLGAESGMARCYGFEEPVTIRWVRNVRRLPLKAGLCVLGFSTGECHVGRSENSRKRVFQHDG